MNNEWTRDDLPHQHEVWDDFVAGKHSDVFHAVDADDLGEVLDEIINHLNAHHPKSQQHDCGESIDALNHNRDALVENRDKSISSLQRLLANTEYHEDRWRRAHSIVEQERDQARERLRETETTLAKVMSDYQDIEDERDEWKTSARLAEQERENWRITAINRAVPAVTREDVEKAIDGIVPVWDSEVKKIVVALHEMVAGDDPAVFVVRESDLPDVERDEDGDWLCENTPIVSGKDTAEDVRGRALPQLKYVAMREAVARAIEAEQATDPVDEKARELWEIGKGMSVNIEFDDIAPDHRGEYLRIARHLLGQRS